MLIILFFMSSKPVILCVDDEKIVLDSLLEQLENNFSHLFSFEMAESAKEALEIIEDCANQNKDIAIIISDQLMPGMKGDEFIIKAHKTVPDAFKILLTGESSIEAISNVINHAQLYRYISKPWEKTDFLLTIDEAAKSYMQKAELKEYNTLLKNLNLASQEISRQVNLSGLIEKFLQLVVDSSNAQKGILFTKKHEKLWYRADYIRRDKKVNLYDFTQNYIIETDDTAPFSIIQSCYQSKNTLLYPAGDNKLFDNNPYIQKNKIKSFIAIPLIKQNKVLSVLYLEHAQNKHCFTPKILEALDLLVSQASISLDNVQLYNNLEKRVRERTKEVVAQKEIIENQNRDILASIRYARRIQENILPSEEQIEKVFSQYCIFYEPKDILSGDFYWFSVRYHYVFLAIADCTGHGVPGAFMSVIGHTLLSQIVNQEDIYEPAQILENLHKKLSKFLGQSESNVENSIRDGMDVAILRYDLLNKKVEFSGAKRPLILISKNELHEVKGSRYSVGGEVNVDNPNYEQHTLQVQSGDRVYIFSDGYADQFNAQDKKRYSHKQFKEFLLQCNNMKMQDIKEALLNEWFKWRGDTEQTDDILIIGIEIP
ncbi:MAG: SpoIIE family protein phosphatase [Bacteroidia bacterium]|nr:SpoIIE family protein phosphatase [Bacteroidia bacterium]MDW8347591.1 SpoIIE family protein phosphatase [Bacteroidia bacterium]